MNKDLDRVLADYLAAIERGDRLDAVAAVTDALAEGLSAESLIEGVIARGQAMVGMGWLEGRWSVAMEHRASGIAESAVSALVETAMRTPGAPREGSAGRAVVACSEGEWHSLPGRMAAEALRLRGIDVTFIGPSVPASELALLIGENVPPVVAITCSMPLSLAGTWRTLSAVRALGAFVVCGGRGFGAEGRWGLALGADAWAANLTAGADLVVAAQPGPRPEPREPGGSPEGIADLAILIRRQDDVLDRALALALELRPERRDIEGGVGQMRRELANNLAAVQAATIVADADLLREHVQWLEALLASRGLPVRMASTALDLVRQALPDDAPLALRLIDEAIESCREAPARTLDELFA